MELAVLVVYAILLALVAPFVLPKSDFYGKLVPFSIALASGSVFWILLTWLGFSYQEAWIWFIVMLGMPAITWFVVSYLNKDPSCHGGQRARSSSTTR
jgi:hypothetical protein